MTPVVVLFGAGIGVGIALLIGGLWSTGPAGWAAVGHAAHRPRQPPGRRCVRWLSPSSSGSSPTGRWEPPSVPGVGWTLRSALQPTTSRRVVGRLEALATWIEALRDSVAAHRGLLAAIESTVAHRPDGFKGTRRRPGARIEIGTPLDQALVAFASGTRRRRGR